MIGLAFLFIFFGITFLLLFWHALRVERLEEVRRNGRGYRRSQKKLGQAG